jgi:hypothetical protein
MDLDIRRLTRIRSVIRTPPTPVLEYIHPAIEARATWDGWEALATAPPESVLLIYDYTAPHLSRGRSCCARPEHLEWSRRLCRRLRAGWTCELLPGAHLIMGDMLYDWHPDYHLFDVIALPPRQCLRLVLVAGDEPMPAGTVTLIGWRYPERDWFEEARKAIK